MNKYRKIYPECELPPIIQKNKLDNDKSLIEKLPLIIQENNKQLIKNTNQK